VNEAALRARLASFYAAHWRRLWAFVRRMGADDATAQDVAQDAFARWALSPVMFCTTPVTIICRPPPALLVEI